MSGGDHIELQGVVDSVGRGIYHCTCMTGDTPRHVIAKLSGRLQKNRIRVLSGDRVSVEVSPYDLGRGRIVYRL